MKKVFVTDGEKWYDYNEICFFMDREISEPIHNELAPCSEQEFFEAYIKAEEEKFGVGDTIRNLVGSYDKEEI